MEKDELGHRGNLFFRLFVCFIFSFAISCVFISVALLACPLHAVSWQLLRFASCTVMLGQLSRDPDDQKHVMWLFFFLTDGGSPVVRQVVHAGVHTVFMSSLSPTGHGGDRVKVGEAG